MKASDLMVRFTDLGRWNVNYLVGNINLKIQGVKQKKAE
jgi:hypothetical protein